MIASQVVILVIVASALPALSEDLSGIRVNGNHFVNKGGQTVRLRGLNRSGTEFMCVQGYGIFEDDGKQNSKLVPSFKAWKANAVRVPLNEDCWLAINGINPAYAGSNYQNALKEYVEMFTNQGMVVILDLHWTAPGSQRADKQVPMPDMDHSVDFWKSVATMFKDNDKVILEMFNEPYPDNGSWDSDEGWKCWRDGGTCNGFNYQAAGMQTLVQAVRGAGATNVILLGGLQWSNSLVKWMKYKPIDSLNNTAVTWHSYNFNYCKDENCWKSNVGTVKAHYPVVCTEFGENDCNGVYVTPLMNWMDSIGISYLAWTFNAWDCNSGPALIKNYDNDGEPTNFGMAVKNHYASQSDF